MSEELDLMERREEMIRKITEYELRYGIEEEPEYDYSEVSEELLEALEEFMIGKCNPIELFVSNYALVRKVSVITSLLTLIPVIGFRTTITSLFKLIPLLRVESTVTSLLKVVPLISATSGITSLFTIVCIIKHESSITSELTVIYRPTMISLISSEWKVSQPVRLESIISSLVSVT